MIGSPVIHAPRLLDKYGTDPSTGAIAPRGRLSKVQEQPFTLGVGEILAPLHKTIEEVADMWTPGNADSGITVRPSDGKVLPTIKHVRIPLPTTDAMGKDLQQNEGELELLRRRSYAEMMRMGKRLTPVHHILGNSELEWQGRISSTVAEARDAWRAKLWVPGNLKDLIDSTANIFTIDWQRLPEDKILEPLAAPLRRAERGRMGTAPALRVKIARAKGDLKVIKAIAAFIQAGDMVKAEKAYAGFAKVEKKYQEEIAKHQGIDPDFGED